MSRLYTDHIAQFIAHYARYPDKLFGDVCGVKLYWWQRMALRMMCDMNVQRRR
nr:MAG TPA: hypothetical protein [Caudoviricetes sp.]